ncbi:hypothetical protein FPOAC2_12978 [Fusarium poae]|jgi:hypothetical protein
MARYPSRRCPRRVGSSRSSYPTPETRSSRPTSTVANIRKCNKTPAKTRAKPLLRLILSRITRFSTGAIVLFSTRYQHITGDPVEEPSGMFDKGPIVKQSVGAEEYF